MDVCMYVCISAKRLVTVYTKHFIQFYDNQLARSILYKKHKKSMWQTKNESNSKAIFHHLRLKQLGRVGILAVNHVNVDFINPVCNHTARSHWAKCHLSLYSFLFALTYEIPRHLHKGFNPSCPIKIDQHSVSD